MKYDARACHFNMDTGCVELLLRDGRMISIDCTGVEDELDVTMARQTELDYLIYNDPLGYADLILNSDPKEYLKNGTGSHVQQGVPQWELPVFRFLHDLFVQAAIAFLFCNSPVFETTGATA